MRTYYGYTPLTDEYGEVLRYPNGDLMLQNNNTQEIVPGREIILPVGSVSYTPEAQDARNAYLVQKAENQFRGIDSISNTEGTGKREKPKFYFVRHDMDFNDLTPQTATRLIYLNTYSDYNNRLMLNRKTPMRKSDLAAILSLSKAAITAFCREVMPKYIIEKEGFLFTNSTVFIRSNLPKREYSPYEKMYITGIRSLYKSTAISNHKHLGYVFKLLPFINIEYNVLCWNPEEKDLEKVRCMTFHDFCGAIGYDVTHLNRLVSAYRSIRFDTLNKPERFCTFVNDGYDISTSKIFVNPRILYNGTKSSEVRVLGIFYKE